MFKVWLISDIELAARKSNRVVISDPSFFLSFIVKDLRDYTVLTLNSNAEEMNARLQAQTSHADKKVIFLCFFPSKDIKQLVEFSGVGGFINFDNPDRYLRDRLYHELGENITLPESKLLLSAKLSNDKSLTWWRGIVNETINPLDLKEHLHLLIENPTLYQTTHDETVFSVLREEVFKAMDKTAVPLDAVALLKELSHAIFSGLLANTLNDSLKDIYYWWTNSSDISPILKVLAAVWNIPNNASSISTNPDHPFEVLDRKMISAIGKALRNNDSLVELTEALRERIKSRKVSNFKPEWLAELMTLLDFDSSDIYRFNTLQTLSEYYRSKFAPLDAAMRHLYNEWLAEPSMLRPLQELYESHLKVLLSAWFSIVHKEYSSSQVGLIEKALSSGKKTAVLVCDGLRLEIAECVAKAIDMTVEVRRNIEFSKLPSITENGMSALFGLDYAEPQIAPRFNKLKSTIQGVEIIQFLNLGNQAHANKLVVLFGDIDTVGEHKGLAGLKDINNYESELSDTIKLLHRLGYEDVYLTADHGFVITGLLAEADKVKAPAGVEVKERFVLSDEYIDDRAFIRREDNFPGGQYQYYSKTDKPFKTRGAYGYAHGGFTPQECLIPFYKFYTQAKHSGIEVSITNKDILAAVTGSFFSVRLKGNDYSHDKRVKVILYADDAMLTSALVKLDNNGEGTAEFEIFTGELSIVVQDVASGSQLDNAVVKKSFSRDLDDLFS